MDNKIFNVNGRTKLQLEKTLELLLLDEYEKQRKVKGWYFDPEKGFVLLWHTEKGGSEFPVPLYYDSVADLVWQWLQDSEDALKMRTGKFEDWDNKLDHDGSNELGWRVYVEDWGHIYQGLTLNNYTLGAIRPVYLWYGK